MSIIQKNSDITLCIIIKTEYSSRYQIRRATVNYMHYTSLDENRLSVHTSLL